MITDGGTLKCYRLPQSDIISGPLKDSFFEYNSFNQRVTSLHYHPTASYLNVLSFRDGHLEFLDTSQSSPSSCLNIDASIHNSSAIQSLSWDFDGQLLSTSSKDMKLRIIDPRSKSPLVSIFEDTHESTKGMTVKWLSRKDLLISCGFSKSGDREMFLWDTRQTKSPLKKEIIDHNPGMMNIYEDPSTGIIFLMGKGDDVIKYYEVREDESTFHYINKFVCKESHSDVCPFPKMIQDVSICEISRFARLTRDKLDHVMFQVPRREKKNNEKIYYEDLYRVIESNQPTLSGSSWLKGDKTKRKLIESSSLKPEGYTSILDIDEDEEDDIGRKKTTFAKSNEGKTVKEIDQESNKQIASKMANIMMLGSVESQEKQEIQDGMVIH